MPPLPACLLKNDASNCKLLSQLRRDGDAYLVGHGEEVLSPRERAARRKQELRTKRPGPLTLGGPARPVVFGASHRETMFRPLSRKDRWESVVEYSRHGNI